jgi:hypothetical protein
MEISWPACACTQSRMAGSPSSGVLEYQPRLTGRGSNAKVLPRCRTPNCGENCTGRPDWLQGGGLKELQLEMLMIGIPLQPSRTGWYRSVLNQCGFRIFRTFQKAHEVAWCTARRVIPAVAAKYTCARWQFERAFWRPETPPTRVRLLLSVQVGG